MDLSKLPKLSDTKSRIQEMPGAPHESTEQNPVPVIALPSRMKIGGEIWFNLIVGMLLLMVARDFGQYVFSQIAHEPFHTNVFWSDDSPQARKEVNYLDLSGFTALSDMGVFLFGTVVFLEAIVNVIAVLVPRSTTILALLEFARFVSLGVILLNCYVCLKLFGINITPTLSVLALLFGGWISINLSRVLKSYKRTWASTAS